jgi:hypothetical protein
MTTTRYRVSIFNSNSGKFTLMNPRKGKITGIIDNQVEDYTSSGKFGGLCKVELTRITLTPVRGQDV